ncbi:hypothetical protein L208DRAFT_1462254 [Tricholoma matsutake]|nr:hypothetical protein L208DRAFT_1462254 [Tricholoma matsutake 945]
MAEQYYTVEGITEARVHGKGKSRHWQYLTAWKGYPADESTWEDVTSFQPTDDDQASSEHFITAFWCHVLGDAIVPDPQEYKTRTHFRLSNRKDVKHERLELDWNKNNIRGQAISLPRSSAKGFIGITTKTRYFEVASGDIRDLSPANGWWLQGMENQALGGII